jgi:hypothetical protein
LCESLQSARACDVNVTGRGASLDCKAVDFSRLDDYNMTVLANGQLVAIDGTDGKYMCSTTAGVRCLQITDSSGTPIQRSPAQRRLESRLGAPFKPLDDENRVCRLKNGAITCKPVKVSELLDALKLSAAIEFEEVVIIGQRLSDTAPAYVSGVAGGGDHRFMQEQAWATDPQTTPERPPNYWKQRCYEICAEQYADYLDVCTFTAGLIWAVTGGNAQISGGYLAACMAGRSWHNMQCRSICDNAL